MLRKYIFILSLYDWFNAITNNMCL